MKDPVEMFRKVISYFNLDHEIDDYERIHENIKRDIVFRGTNLWILVFAIIVASVGLNMNSTAVIIGAMLISPLMGPINGMGYSIATYNFELLRQSLKNFTFAVLASLVASTTYFFLSPISTAHSELLARTSPTIYDVLIALFGGLAGIVALSSRQKGNVIPGVAIATALMPPLCTAGYGLATAQWTYFFGAIYLFTINTVFIALSSVAISQILKFPIRTLVNEAQRKHVNRWISAVIVLVIIPSIYFGYGLVKNEKFNEMAQRYISNVQLSDGNYLLNHEVDAETKTIELTYGGVTMADAQKETIIAKAADFDLQDAEVVIRQGLSVDRGADGRKEVELLMLRQQVAQKTRTIDSLGRRSTIGRKIFNELRSLYPQIHSGFYADTYQYSAAPEPVQISVVQITLKPEGKLNNDEVKTIERWLAERLERESVKLIVDTED